MLDAFADRVSKPRLFLTDKMQIALGKLERGFIFFVFQFTRLIHCPRDPVNFCLNSLDCILL